MKKLLMFAMLFMLVFAAACSQDSEDTGNNKEEGTEETNSEEENAAADEADLKSDLLTFQAEVVDVLQANHAAFGEFAAAKTTFHDAEVAAEEKPTEEELNTLMEAAKAAGPTAAEAIRAIEVPASLEQYKEDIEAALEDAAKSYEVRAENVTIEAKEDAQAEADALFTSFEEKFGVIFEDLGLTAPSFSAEL
ncbi:hypothetical protein [Alkalihalobacillus sp. AL-G]|uniref:hypothetical protein n=1 Tax=Alkalihalobacillus sp. AL-G TaxID=2926399 RepID=UPI00272A0DA5|nr:hypothetical protein [Alkalihalobacillus sp. AL-G]WLD93424.1 hypothetical protein MOJ78_00180 [Alkalihalobacillus sp. AL-G]